MRVLSRLFRRLFLEALQRAFDRQELVFFGELEALRAPQAFARYLQPLHKREWVVYCKPPFGGPEAVLAYLARYTHRVAIGNQRLQSMENHQVTFQWKDYQHGNRLSDMTLSADEFIRRFLLHALPKGFQRIRHYGFLANAHRQEKLELCRKLLWQDLTGLLPLLALVASLRPSAQPATADSLRCPVCRTGVMVCLEVLPHQPGVDSS